MVLYQSIEIRSVYKLQYLIKYWLSGKNCIFVHEKFFWCNSKISQKNEGGNASLVFCLLLRFPRTTVISKLDDGIMGKSMM